MPPLQELSWVQLVYFGHGNYDRSASKHWDKGYQMKASVMRSCPDKDLRMEGNSGCWRSMEKEKADNKYGL